MKLRKYAIASAIISVTLFTACTPNSLDENGEQQPQSVDKRTLRPPTAG